MKYQIIIERSRKKSLPMASAYLFENICHCLPHSETWGKLDEEYWRIEKIRKSQRSGDK